MVGLIITVLVMCVVLIIGLIYVWIMANSTNTELFRFANRIDYTLTRISDDLVLISRGVGRLEQESAKLREGIKNLHSDTVSTWPANEKDIAINEDTLSLVSQMRDDLDALTRATSSLLVSTEKKAKLKNTKKTR